MQASQLRAPAAAGRGTRGGDARQGGTSAREARNLD
jgi:hypothetical protein